MGSPLLSEYLQTSGDLMNQQNPPDQPFVPEHGVVSNSPLAGGLREALEKRLCSLPVMTYDNGYPVEALPKAELLALLAMYSECESRWHLVGPTRAQPICLDCSPAAAVHEAYVNAQRAVAAIEWGGGSDYYRHGRATMQEDAVRAIRAAAEGGQVSECPDNPGGTHFKITARGGDDESLGYMHCGFCGEVQP